MKIFTQLSRMPKLVGAGLLAGLAVAAFTGQANAGCKSYLCVHGSDDGNIHNVYVEPNVSGGQAITHYNIRMADGRQIEVSRDDTRFSFKVKSGRTYKYGVQGCIRGGVLQKSKCFDWVTFTHTVD
jgi:hypothetical protein